MARERYTTSGQNNWNYRSIYHRPPRFSGHGPIRPMEEPGMVERWMQFFRRK